MSFDYVQRTKAMPGKKCAATALRWIADGAESPMEIKSRLLLTLPYRYGGYGLPMPEVNKDILLSGRTEHRVVRTFRPDMCWPCHKVIVEYDGKAYHEDAHKDKPRPVHKHVNELFCALVCPKCHSSGCVASSKSPSKWLKIEYWVKSGGRER